MFVASNDRNLQNSLTNNEAKGINTSKIDSKSEKEMERSDAFISENMIQSTKRLSLTNFSVKKSSNKNMKSLI